MNNKPQTVFVQVDCNEPPTGANRYYYVIDDNYPAQPLTIGYYSKFNNSWMNEDDDCIHPTAWLKPLPASIVLSVEEYENIQWQIKELERQNKYLIESKDIPF